MTRKKLPTQTNQTKQPQLIACCHGKHVWRIEESVLEQFIQDQYAATRERQKAENPQ